MSHPEACPAPRGPNEHTYRSSARHPRPLPSHAAASFSFRSTTNSASGHVRRKRKHDKADAYKPRGIKILRETKLRRLEGGKRERACDGCYSHGGSAAGSRLRRLLMRCSFSTCSSPPPPPLSLALRALSAQPTLRFEFEIPDGLARSLPLSAVSAAGGRNRRLALSLPLRELAISRLFMQ